MERANCPDQQAVDATIPQEQNHLSRRTWLGSVSLPALSAAGAGLLGLRASYSE